MIITLGMIGMTFTIICSGYILYHGCFPKDSEKKYYLLSKEQLNKLMNESPPPEYTDTDLLEPLLQPTSASIPSASIPSASIQ